MLKLFVLYCFFSFFYFISCYNSDAYKTFTEYLESYNYPFEEYYLTTKDSYILKIFRVQSKFQTKILPETEGKVILIMHGLADSSDTYIVNKEEWAPALFLANKKHDVWLGNVRGNKHSRNHTTLNPDKDKSFWDFSIDEFANIDLPDTCEFIFNKTNKKIHYVGHSQGSTIMFAAMASKNEIILKTVEKFMAFGPVVFLQFAKTVKPLKSFVNNQIVESLVRFLEQIGGEFFIPEFLKNSLVNAVCAGFKSICDAGFETLLEFLVNIDPKVDYMKRSEVFMTHYPGGTSIKTLIHWYQLLKNKEDVFRKFDYGKEGNLKKYGQEKPEIYDFDNIGEEIKIYLYIGHFDRVGTKTDILKLKEKIKSSKIFHQVYPLGHSSFVWGKELTYFLEDVNEDINDCHCKKYDL